MRCKQSYRNKVSAFSHLADPVRDKAMSLTECIKICEKWECFVCNFFPKITHRLSNRPKTHGMHI